jgi:hypothetical protein
MNPIMLKIEQEAHFIWNYPNWNNKPYFLLIAAVPKLQLLEQLP